MSQLPPIRGPFGIWPFPLLNTLVTLVGRIAPPGYLGSRSFIGARPVAAENYERILWTDWRGRERYMDIHREVR